MSLAIMMFSLIQLPYELTDLEPVISARTLEFHHGRHLKGYVDNLNKLIPGSKWEPLCHSGRSEESVLKEIVAEADGAVFNNAGQILNHNMYFSQFSSSHPEASHSEASHSEECHPERSEGSQGPLMAQIIRQWGDLEAFQKEFVAKGTGLFGSGWVWLSAKEDGTLEITQESGASNPVVKGLRPLLTFDVWEHAYYLDYQNRRADHLAALWRILDWAVVEGRYHL